jgi:hypothetical protein
VPHPPHAFAAQPVPEALTLVVAPELEETLKLPVRGPGVTGEKATRTLFELTVIGPLIC